MNDTAIELRVNPTVPMQMYTCLPYVLALGAARALAEKGMTSGLAWPATVTVGGQPVARVSAHAGYDAGMFADVVLSIDAPGPLAATDSAADAPAPTADDELAEALREAMAAACESWEAALRRAQVVAGPLAPIMGEYFDLLDLAGKDVEVVYPNGNLAARGVFAGIDVWGRATVKAYSGRELEYAPEQVSIRAAQE